MSGIPDMRAEPSMVMASEVCKWLLLHLLGVVGVAHAKVRKVRRLGLSHIVGFPAHQVAF